MLAGLSFRAMAKHHLSNWHRVEVVCLHVGCVDISAAVAAVEMPHCVDGSAANTGVKMQHRVDNTSAAVAGVKMQHCVDTSAAVAGVKMPHTDSLIVASATPVPVLLADCAAHLPVPMGDYYYDYNYTRS